VAGHGGNEPIDVLRKGAIVVLLVMGLWLLHRFAPATGGVDPTAMLALGFVVLASYTFGELVGVVKLPHITGYLLAGVLLGPSAASYLEGIFGAGNVPPPFGITGTYHDLPEGGVLSFAVQDTLGPFNILAIALIAMTAGGELRLETLRDGLKTILGVLGGQIAIIVPTIMLLVFLISGQLPTEGMLGYIAMPFKEGVGTALGQLDVLGVLLLGGVVAAISIATSPAATIAVINGTKAKGPTTQSILSAVVMKDVVVVLLFSILAAVSAAVISPDSLMMTEEDRQELLEREEARQEAEGEQAAHATEGDQHASDDAHGAPGAAGTSHEEPHTSDDTHGDDTHGDDSHGGGAAHGDDTHGDDSHGAGAAHGDDSHGEGGHGAAGDHAAPTSLLGFMGNLSWHILGSLLIGLAVGWGIAQYLKYIGVEVLLFLVGVVFTVAYVGDATGLDATLVFIAAGFAATNFSKEGENLIHEVEKLGMPVYVVFFTLTGAHLNISQLVQLLPFVIPLVGVRMFAIWAGIRAGTAVTGAPEPVKKYAWLGFLSQAGVAIALANLVGSQFGDAGSTLQALIIAGVAVHEVVGPVALKAALGMAKEIPSAASTEQDAPADEPGEDHALTEPADDQDRLRVWEAPGEVEDPWGVVPKTASPAIDEIGTELRSDLEGIILDVQDGHLAEWSAEAHEYLHALRREFLRHHRHISVALADGAPDLLPRSRTEMASLADHWRDLVLARSAEVGGTTWSPDAISDAVEDMVVALPEALDAPYEPETLQGPEHENTAKAAWRGVFRTWHRVASSVGSGVPTRRVPVREVASYHLLGLLPGRLEGIAALLITGEQHLQRRTRSLFDTVARAYEAFLDASDEPGADPSDVLARVRRRIEEEFALARDEVDAIGDDGVLRTSRILADSWRDVVDDLPRVGTLDLPRRKRRLSRVFTQRTKGLDKLSKGLDRARKSTAARYDALALDLEIVRLEGRIRDLVEEHGDQLARNVRGKGATQVVRVEAALRDALTQTEHLLQEDLPAGQLATALRDACAPLDHIAEDAARAAGRLRDQLADEQALTPLLDALLLAARDLTDRYTVPVGPEREGEWKLPPPTPTTEVPFREIVQAFVETTVTRDLSELTRSLADDAQSLAATLDEFDRLVAFNVELATGELDLIEDDAVPDATLSLVHDMIIGNLTRARGRLETVREGSDAWSDRASNGVYDAVLGELDALRAQIQEGRVSELRVRLLREAAAGRRLVRRAGGLTGLARSVMSAFEDIAQGVLGPSGLDQAQRVLGLPVHAAERRPEPTTFAEVLPEQDLPMVYRRLFSDAAMEAGDLLTGRRRELERARRVLDGELGGRLRSVALVGSPGVGKRALISALVRKVDTRDIERIVLEEPATPDSVATWFDTDARDRLFVVEGFQWLFSMEPGGMDPLRAFARGLVRDDGRNRWLVHVDTPLWAFADRVSELEDAFAEVIELNPLSVDSLAEAILARHAMSGYELQFEADPGLNWQVRALFRPSTEATDRGREAWFAALHAATGGLLNDALRLWMASILRVDEDKGLVVIGDTPPGPLDALRQLPDYDLLTLRLIARQGVMDVGVHAWLFRTSEVSSEAHLGHLAHLGLLRRTDAGFTVAPHLKGAVIRVLAERGWDA